MPSFLSKVFGRKKDDKDSSPTNQLGPGELLGGKFEAISPNVSPNATHYLELPSDTVPASDDYGRIINEEKDFGLSFFRTKSRSPEVKPKRLFDTLPPLSLDFDLKDKSAYNGYIFEESNSEAVFPDNVLGQRRLNPTEALVLIRACSDAIISRGLETLGIMTPHWYSASPDIQRRLVSNFLRSLDLTTSTEAAVPSSPHLTTFEEEVNSTRSIHDVAAVLRWGLRHVQLEGDRFGTTDGWYKAFFDAEVANDYPLKAFSEKLAPSLPASHLDLVVSTLELFSSLAAFSEANSTSGSRLCKIFGLWLFTARVGGKDDWQTFYARWERTGRMLEHLFLARIRDQSTDQRMPTRLLDLVRKYPFTQGLSPPTTDLQLLPYPQFTTALHPALFVRVQYEVTSQKRIPKTKIKPSVLLADAFSTKVEEGEFVELWAKITSAASKAGSELPLGNVFANDTLRLLSLVGDKPKEEVKSPSLSVISLVEPRLQRAASNGAASFSLVKPNIESAPLTTSANLSPLGGDWEQFSASGFLGIDQTFPPLVSTLFDTDIEKTEPRNVPLPISRKSSRRAVRKSLELPRSVVIADSSAITSPDASKPESSKARQEVITASHFEVIELDEAFVDFWSDAMLDPIASDWPTFAICKFKPALVPDLTCGTGDETTKKTLKWLVLEQVYSVKPRPVPSPLLALPESTEPSSALPASPIAQTPTGRRLFNFWSMSRTPSSSSTGSQKGKKTPKTPKVGEMGELIEEDEGKIRSPSSRKFKSLELGIRRSGGKKSHEKKSSVDVTRPEISVTPPTDIDAARATTSTIVAAAAAATTTGLQLGADKQESDIVKVVDLPTVPEAVAESVLVSVSTDDASKQDLVPVEVALADVEKADVTTIPAAISEQDAQIIDVGAPAELTLPETDKEPTKGEADASTEGDFSHHPQEVDRSFLVSAAPTSAELGSNQPLPPGVELPVQQDEEQKISISSAIGEADKPVPDQVTGVYEELQTPLIAGEDERIDSGVAEATTTTEPETKISEPVEEDTSEGVPSVEVKPEAFSTLPVANQVPATVAEEAGTDTSVPTLVPVTEPAPIADGSVVVDESSAIEAHPELDEIGLPIEEVSKVVAVAPTEIVLSSVENVATRGIPPAAEEMEAGESFVGGLQVPGDSLTAIVDHIEEVLPATELSTVIEAPPMSDDASAPLASEEIPIDTESAVQNEVPDHALEVGGAAHAAEVLSVVEADTHIDTLSEAIAPKTSAERAIVSESHVPTKTAVEGPEPSVNAPVQELSANVAEPPVNVVTPQETAGTLPMELEVLEPPTTEDSSLAEGSLDVEIGGIKETTAAGEVPVNEGAAIVEEPGQEAHAIEPELPVEVAIVKSVDADIPEIREAVEALSETSLVAVQPESEGTPEQPIISSEEPATEAVPTTEEPSQELPGLKEDVPTQLETKETPLVEPQPPTEEPPHEESALETKLSEELPALEPETALEDAPIEVPQAVEEPNATNEAPLEDATLAEAAALEVPEREVLSSISEVPGAGETSMPEEETPLELAERAEESLKLGPPSEDAARFESVPFTDPPPMSEVTPPAEEEYLVGGTPTATNEVTTTFEEVKATDETPVGVREGIGAVERSAGPTEINESDAPAESVTASVPEVSAESPRLAEEATPVTEPVASAEASAIPDVPEDTPAIELPTAVDEPALPADDVPEQPEHVSVDGDSLTCTSTPIVEIRSHEPPPFNTSPVQETLPAETSILPQATPLTDRAEVSAVVEQPSTFEESLLSAVDAEKKPPSNTLEGVSPLVDDVSVPAEMPPVIPDAEQPRPTVALTTAEATREVGPQPEAEPATGLPESTSAASGQPAESAIPAPADVPADTDQPIHSLEVEHPAVEGGIIDEPIVESAVRDDLSPDEPTIPDAPVTISRTDISNEPSEEASALNKAADATAHTLDPPIATSIPEKGPVETQNSPLSIIEPPNAAEPDSVPTSLDEPSSESGDPVPTEQFEGLTEELPVISEHIDIAAIDANEPAILEEVDGVPALDEESRAVAEPREEPTAALLEDAELAGELSNGVGHTKTATGATDTTIVAPDDDADLKTVVDESAASEPSTS